MSRSTLGGWLAGRVPPVPGPFLPRLLEAGNLALCKSEELGRIGENVLGRALENPGRNRAAAFDLLAGDALLTYACEALAEEDGDVGDGLDALIQRLGTRFP
jgi:hypothetical protein